MATKQSETLLEDKRAAIVRLVLAHYPAAQGVYLFGSYGTADERPDSDVDVALLLPPDIVAHMRTLRGRNW